MAFWPWLVKIIPSVIDVVPRIISSVKGESKISSGDASTMLVEQIKPLGEMADAYVSGKINEAKTYIDGAISRIDKSVDAKIADAKGYIDAKNAEVRSYLDGKIAEAERYVDAKMVEAQRVIAAESRALTRRLLWIALAAWVLQTATIVGAILLLR